MSIRYKIALLYSTIVTLLFTIISIAVYFFSKNERDILFTTRLKNRALTTFRVYADIKDSSYTILKRMDAVAVASLYNKSITITDLEGRHRYLYADKPGDSLYLSADIIEQAKNNGDYSFEQLGKKAVAVYQIDDNTGYVVVAAAEDYDGQEYLKQLEKILAISFGLSVVLSFLSGIIFAKSLIKPIAQITKEVNLITANNFSRRINTDANGDELSRLGATFNNLLDRLQDSFDTQRRFISNASHELSTPLTSVSSQLEVALQKERSPAEYGTVLTSIYDDIKELQQLTHTLLDLAKAGSEGGIELKEVRLDEVLFKAISDLQKQNPHYKIHIDVNELPYDEKLLTVFGNSNLLYIAIKNIIENGCKYSDDKRSAVTAFFDKASVSIEIFNKGDVISEADIENIFQPFFRASSALQRSGFGLGLTLAKKIIALHKGTVSVESSLSAGTFFRINLPNILSFNNL